MEPVERDVAADHDYGVEDVLSIDAVGQDERSVNQLMHRIKSLKESLRQVLFTTIALCLVARIPHPFL
jgi:hypothetical protein